MGLARELVSDFLEPLPDAANLWKFNVERSSDRREYRLFCEGGEFLMYGKVARDCRRVEIFMYDPSERNAKTLYGSCRPAFILTANQDKTDWRLLQDRCDCCRHCPAGEQRACSSCGGRGKEILRAKHSNLEVGDGINHCMDVSVPASGPMDEEHRFVSKMPVWNEKVECLVLDFKGRKIQASAKNFQLALEHDESERVVCQYGKLDNDNFGLDFRYPLTVSQAFGLALTTILWE
mmetsp:Transcript_39834/g.85982  ORF Transcript_39834/g.85982 Transcript_39834/m.85982 type:complete len:235 (-) Transcript_39834:4-708(-)